MAGLVVDVIVVGQGADRDKPVGASLGQGHEQAEPGDAVDAALENGVDSIR